MGAEKFGTTPGALDREVFDGVLGDAEELGDFLLGIPFNFAEQDHFALTFGEGVDGFAEEGQLLGVAEGLDGAPLFFQDWQGDGFRYRNMIGAGPEGEKVADGIAGDREKQRLGGADPVVFLGAEEAQVGFLGGIVSVGRARQGLAQIGPEGAIMRLDFPGKPRGMVRVGDWAGPGGRNRRRLAQDKGDQQAARPAGGGNQAGPAPEAGN